MIAEQLRKAILQAAMQGKLTEQLSTDGDARDLLAQISKEKQKLIKEWKIKKEKLPELIGADEIPFEIPANWQWIRLGEIISLLSGQDLQTSNYNNQQEGIPYITGASNINNCQLLINRWTKTPKCIAEPGDLLITCKGTVGEMAFLPEQVGNVHIARQLMSLRIIGSCNPTYVFFVLQGRMKELQNKSQGIIPGITRDVIINALFPLPPLAEQKRIVERVDELMKKINEIEKPEMELFGLNKAFPDSMRNSLLQAAVQGKLTEQLPSDGDARDLLAQISKEKQKLIKEGKIKKEKTSKSITEDEIPFEVPKNWCFIKLFEVGSIVGGGTPKTNVPEYWEGTVPWLTPADMKYVSGKYVSHGERFISYQGLSNSSAQLMPKGTVLYSSRAPIGYIAIATEPICTNQGFKSVVPIGFVSSEFLYYAIIQRTQEIKSRASGTTFKEISGTEFGKTVIPLPPLAEQKRIVERLEKLLPLCDELTEEKG